MMMTQSEPSREEIQTALNGVVGGMLRPGAALLAASHLCHLAAHAVLLPPESRGLALFVDGITALIGLGLWYFFKKPVPVAFAQRYAALMIAIVLLNFAVQTALVSNPNAPVYALLVIVGAGCFLLSWGWLAAAIIGSLLVWAEGIILHPANEGLRLSHIFAIGVMLSLLVHWIRLKTYGESERVKSQLRRARSRLEERMKFEHVLTNCSTRLLASSGEEIDQTLLEAMEAVAEWLEIDYVCVCRLEGSPTAFRTMEEWCAPDAIAKNLMKEHFSTHSLPWCWERLTKDHGIQIHRLEDLPKEAQSDKAYLAEVGIRSFFSVPLSFYGRTWGLLTLASERREVEWSLDTTRLLKVLGEIILAAVHRKEAESEISHLNQQLEQASRLVGLGEMAANLAHDLSNGVAAVLQFSQGAAWRSERGTLTLEKSRECIADIQEQADSMRDIVRTTQEFVRTGICQKARVTLADLVRQSELLVRGKLRQKSIQTHYAVPEDLPPVWADPSQITIVLVNLLLNSTHAMERNQPEDRSIVVSATENDSGFVEISLRDNGAGIPAELREKVFEKFYTTKTEGLGLGLAFSRLYIEQHGGKIWCDPECETGCDMRFTLPIASQQEDLETAVMPDDLQNPAR